MVLISNIVTTSILICPKKEDKAGDKTKKKMEEIFFRHYLASGFELDCENLYQTTEQVNRDTRSIMMAHTCGLTSLVSCFYYHII